MCISDRNKADIMYKSKFSGLLSKFVANIKDALAAGDMKKAQAVSYTHLDVYKRQVLRGRSPTLELRHGPNSYGRQQ